MTNRIRSATLVLTMALSMASSPADAASQKWCVKQAISNTDAYVQIIDDSIKSKTNLDQVIEEMNETMRKMNSFSKKVKIFHVKNYHGKLEHLIEESRDITNLFLHAAAENSKLHKKCESTMNAKWREAHKQANAHMKGNLKIAIDRVQELKGIKKAYEEHWAHLVNFESMKSSKTDSPSQVSTEPEKTPVSIPKNQSAKNTKNFGLSLKEFQLGKLNASLSFDRRAYVDGEFYSVFNANEYEYMEVRVWGPEEAINKVQIFFKKRPGMANEEFEKALKKFEQLTNEILKKIFPHEDSRKIYSEIDGMTRAAASLRRPHSKTMGDRSIDVKSEFSDDRKNFFIHVAIGLI